MKAILLCSDAPNQRALANRLRDVVTLTEIAIIAIPPAKQKRTVASRAASLTVGYPLRHAWSSMLGHFEQRFPKYPDVPISHHYGVNSASVTALIKAIRPDLVLVSGTDLLRKPLIEACNRGGARIMNLHTGLSPYIRGGPNCTNWSIALGRPDLIGNTMMWLDDGIDTGSIIATRTTSLTRHDSLSTLHVKVMNDGHDLYCDAVRRFVDGRDLPSVEQTGIAQGRLFLTKHWTAKPIMMAVARFYFRVWKAPSPDVVTVPLNG